MEKSDVIIIHGADYKNMARRALGQAGMAANIGDVNKKTALKPNLVTTKVSSSGATTHSELLAGVVEYLREHGFQNITITERSWVGDRTEDAFQAAGYHRVCGRYSVPFVDLQRDTWEEYDAAGMKTKLCDKAAAVDYTINMPVLRGHCQTTVTCALKNSKNVIPSSERRRFHTLGLHKPIAHLNTIARSDFILVDNICGDLDFGEGDDPVVMNRVLGFKDPVLCDAFVCDCMGYLVDDVSYITMAEKLGVGSTDIAHANMIYLNQATETDSKFRMARRVQHPTAYTALKGAYSACYGSLIYALDRLNDMGYLRKGPPPVCIGQGYKERDDVIGVGQCTSCFAKILGGRPPKVADIVDLLSTQWK